MSGEAFWQPLPGTGGGGGTVTFSGCRAKKTTAQSLTTNVVTAINFTDPEDFDTDNYHDLVTNPSRFTAPSAGKYRITAAVNFAANATNQRLILLRVNGATFQTEVAVGASGDSSTALHVADLLDLAAGGYVELCARQRSGGALNVTQAILAIEKAPGS